jgi:nitrate/nitrite transporter NarK
MAARPSRRGAVGPRIALQRELGPVGAVARVIALGFVYMGLTIPQYGLSFFPPQIVKDFGLSNVQAGFVTALPYLVGAIGMVLWARHSDRTGERKWHVLMSFAAMVVGLGLASIAPSSVTKMAVLCIAGWGFFSILPVFWTLPTAFLSGAGAAAGIAAVNSIGNLGGYFGPKIFGQLRDWTGTDFAGLMFLAGCAIIEPSSRSCSDIIPRSSARRRPRGRGEPTGVVTLVDDPAIIGHITSCNYDGTPPMSPG